MTGRSLNILFTPSAREGPWIDGVRAAAQAKGLTVGRWADEDEADILIADHIPSEKVLTLEPRDWVVLGDTPQAGLSAYGAAFQEDPPAGQSLLYANIRLASAAWLAERGAPVLGQPAMALSLPKLGLVTPAAFKLPVERSGPLAPLLSVYDGLPVRIGAQSVWGAEHFSFPADGQEDGGPARIDLTGRARRLVYGPYVWLPPGLWRATIRVAVDPEGRDAPLSFDWGIAHDLVSVEETVDEAGYYSVSLERYWEWPAPAYIQVHLTQPLFQGTLEFLDCTIERLPEPAPKLDLETETNP